MVTKAPVPNLPAPTALTDITEDVDALEATFKSDFQALKPETQKLYLDALAAAKAEGSVVATALHSIAASL